MKLYKIKLEDKAAFLNRLEKAGIPADSYDVVDNKFKGYFEFTTDNPVTDNIVKTIFKQSPKINKITEMKKITKEQLVKIVREELSASKKQDKLNEINPDVMSALQGAGVLTGLFGAAAAVVKAGLAKLKNDIKAKNPNISDEAAEEAAGNMLRGSLDKTLGKNVDMDRWDK